MRVRTYMLALFAVLALPLGGCDRGTGPGEPPPAPLLLPNPPDTSPDERGIDAIPERDWIRLEWVAVEWKDLAGYEVWRRAEDEAVPKLVDTIPVEGATGDTISWDDTDVSLLVEYFYNVRSFTRSGLKSDRSNTVSYMLLAKPQPSRPSPQEVVRDPRPVFRFLWGESGDMIRGFVVKLVDESGNYIWISDPGTYSVEFGYSSEVRYNSDGKALSERLPPGDYRWRVDASGDPGSGSESVWVAFQVAE